MTETKKLVQAEILALLEENIDNNIELMSGDYTVADIARECLYEWVYEDKKKEEQNGNKHENKFANPKGWEVFCC